ncbi:hypothetical protein AA16373_1641 [Komagataeibacter swingsii DSM 16373]|nr:hypothetical protein AA16373_1641 [Komagataeibacter swingsii DSM 16373]
MQRRGILPEWVKETVLKPEWSEVDPVHAGRMRSYRTIAELGNRILRVVHWTEGSDIVVLTVFPDRDAEKRRPKS